MLQKWCNNISDGKRKVWTTVWKGGGVDSRCSQTVASEVTSAACSDVLKEPFNTGPGSEYMNLGRCGNVWRELGSSVENRSQAGIWLQPNRAFWPLPFPYSRHLKHRGRSLFICTFFFFFFLKYHYNLPGRGPQRCCQPASEPPFVSELCVYVCVITRKAIRS